MPILDFTELSQPESSFPLGEEFENLVRELGKQLGLRPEWSGRGGDQGRDLFFTEHRRGSLGTTEIRWLVSCKDKARSGRSVTEQDVGSVSDKLAQHNAQGFLLATTTTASTGLKAMLDGLGAGGSVTTQVWDRSEIENLLLRDAHIDLVKRYLPTSYASYKRLSSIPQALDSLKLLMPDAIFQKIKLVLESYQVNDVWLSGDHIWPHDRASSDTIDRAISALFEKDDPAEAAVILSREDIEFEAFDATLNTLVALRPVQTRELCRSLVKEGNSEGPAFFAFQFLLQHFELHNEEQIELAVELASEDLFEIYAEEIRTFISGELSTRPENYSAWSDLDALSSATRFEGCHAHEIYIKPNKILSTIEFTASVNVSVSLTFGREDAGYSSLFGTADGYIDPHGIYLNDFTVDTTSVHE